MHKKLILTTGFALLTACLPALAQTGSAVAPLMGVLDRFTASDVPAFGPAEIEMLPRAATNVVPANLPGKGLAQHAMIYVGEGYNKIYLVSDGKVIWTYSAGRGGEFDDVWMLSNGNILYSRSDYVAEITPKKEVIWRYNAPTNTQIHCCQPIGMDKVLFIQNGLPPKLMVVNIKTKEVETSHEVPAKSVDDPKTIHPQYRRVRMTAAGTYLVPALGLGTNGVVLEYDKDFKEIWRYPIRSPWAAIRLKNGNTLISDESDKLIREVNRNKETVWELKPDDLPAEYRYQSTQTCTRLANGNTIVCSRKAPQLVEVTPDKKVVWVLNDFNDLGPATAVQILDDPGVPENPGESEH
jgi:hypothetical protein